MGAWFESTFHGTRGQELFYQAWCVADTPPSNKAVRTKTPTGRKSPNNSLSGDTSSRGTILLTHGLSEHSETYTFFAKPMRAAMWNVVAWDLPGHGRSPGKRGYVPEFDDYVRNLALLYEHITQSFPPPFVVLGHSMGGLITLKTQLTRPLKNVSAVCLSAPALALSLQASWLKDKMARVAQKYAPRLTFANEIRYDQLVHSPDVQNEYRQDPLRHDRISPQVYYGMLESQKEVLELADTLDVPFLMQLAGLDKVVNNEAAHIFYHELGGIKKESHTYDNSLHVVLKDIEQASVLKDLKKFLNQVCKNKAQAKDVE